MFALRRRCDSSIQLGKITLKKSFTIYKII